MYVFRYLRIALFVLSLLVYFFSALVLSFFSSFLREVFLYSVMSFVLSLLSVCIPSFI